MPINNNDIYIIGECTSFHTYLTVHISINDSLGIVKTLSLLFEYIFYNQYLATNNSKTLQTVEFQMKEVNRGEWKLKKY